MAQGVVKSITRTSDGFPDKKTGEWVAKYEVVLKDGKTYFRYTSKPIEISEGDTISFNESTSKSGEPLMSKINTSGKEKRSSWDDPDEILKMAKSTAISMTVKYLAKRKHPKYKEGIIEGAKLMMEWLHHEGINRNDLLKKYHALDEAINCLDYETEIFTKIESLSELFAVADTFYKYVSE